MTVDDTLHTALTPARMAADVMVVMARLAIARHNDRDYAIASCAYELGRTDQDLTIEHYRLVVAVLATDLADARKESTP